MGKLSRRASRRNRHPERLLGPQLDESGRPRVCDLCGNVVHEFEEWSDGVTLHFPNGDVTFDWLGHLRCVIAAGEQLGRELAEEA